MLNLPYQPEHAAEDELRAEITIVLGLIALELRGLKESIKIRPPLLLGFVFTHLALVTYVIRSMRAIVPMS